METGLGGFDDSGFSVTIAFSKHKVGFSREV